MAISAAQFLDGVALLGIRLPDCYRQRTFLNQPQRAAGPWPSRAATGRARGEWSGGGHCCMVGRLPCAIGNPHVEVLWFSQQAGKPPLAAVETYGPSAERLPLDAGRGMGRAYWLGFGGASLAQVHREDGHRCDGQEFGLPVLQGAIPEVGGAEVLRPRDGGLQVSASPGKDEVVQAGDAEHGVVDAVSLESAVAKNLLALHPGEDVPRGHGLCGARRNGLRCCSVSAGPRWPVMRSAADLDTPNSGASWRKVRFVRQDAATRSTRSSRGRLQAGPCAPGPRRLVVAP